MHRPCGTVGDWLAEIRSECRTRSGGTAGWPEL